MTLISTNPADGTRLGEVEETGVAELAHLLSRASAAASEIRWAPAAQRASWIGAVADALDNQVDALVKLAHAETGLPEPRLVSEVARTTTQLRLLAAHAETAAPFLPTIDTEDPTWKPAARPDLRSLAIGIGPVLVFAASNFPFAFSVVGGDTASAWAAGCPVIVKTHPGHPLLSQKVADLAWQALADAGAPAGMFGAIYGFDAGIAALSDARVRAGTFTGSVSGGRALFAIANSRREPIPFFAEMGSVNPVVITERASDERAATIAQSLADSFLLGTGQFCTKPGLVFTPAGSEIPKLLAEIVSDRPATLMLNTSMRDRHRAAIEHFLEHPNVELHARGCPPHNNAGAYEAATVAITSLESLRADLETIGEEHFGPSTLLVEYGDETELISTYAEMPGSLTATIQRGEGEDITELVRALAERAGRIVVNEWPTGVAVTWAQFHGGPYPATTDPRYTSVGTGAISRFVRPIALQGVPEQMLPNAVRDSNPLNLLRRVNGVLTADVVQR